MQISDRPILSAAILCLAVYAILPTTQAVPASCDPSPKACTKHLAPVCATFKKTFSNRCMMESELCRLAMDGFHFVQADEGSSSCCSEASPLMYWPVCASNGKTYDNMWIMDSTACKNRDYLVEVPSENCPEFPKNWGGNSGGGWGSS